MLARKLWSLAVGVCMVTAFCGTQAVLAASNEAVEYRLTTWKSAHFNSEKDALKVLQTLKQLNCEVKQEAHDGHTDVIYRCPSWRVHKAKSHDEAHQWESWFKTYGFETKHSH